jgi:hypothetical protein
MPTRWNVHEEQLHEEQLHEEQLHEEQCSIRSLGLGLMLGLAACANPNLYAVPRTVEKNRLEFVVAPEVTGFGGSQPGESASEFERLVPALPTVGVRYGLSDHVDIGGRLSNLLTTSGDIKWNPIRSPFLDLAIAPGVQFYSVFGVGEDADLEDLSEDSRPVFITHLPLLVGINLSRSFILVPTVGLSYAFAKAPPSSASDIERSQVIQGAFLRAGLGIDLTLVEHLAVHPEFTVMRGFTEMDGYMLFMGGVGFVFGRLPKY